MYILSTAIIKNMFETNNLELENKINLWTTQDNSFHYLIVKLRVVWKTLLPCLLAHLFIQNWLEWICPIWKINSSMKVKDWLQLNLKDMFYFKINSMSFRAKSCLFLICIYSNKSNENTFIAIFLAKVRKKLYPHR